MLQILEKEQLKLLQKQAISISLKNLSHVQSPEVSIATLIPLCIHFSVNALVNNTCKHSSPPPKVTPPPEDR